MSYIPIENLDMRIAQISIAQQSFASNSEFEYSVLLTTLVCDDVGVVTVSGDGRSFTLAPNKDYFIIATMNGRYFPASGNEQICFAFYDNTSGAYVTTQSASRTILTHNEFRGHCSSTVEMLSLQTASPLTLSIRALFFSAGYYRTDYFEDSSPASVITIMYKDIY